MMKYIKWYTESSPNIVNNFDLLRVFAAFQVVLHHSIEHLEIKNCLILFIHNNFLKYFPGVPIFFFISGMLIFWSYERNSNDIAKYCRNRLLRIYPGLWVCFIFTILLLGITYGGKLSYLYFNLDFLTWSIGQITFFQFYTPAIMNYFGVGTPNGSLWTIMVELQFYIIIPFFYLLLKRNKILIGLLFILAIIANFVVGYSNDEDFIVKILKVSVVPYLYYFLFGITLYIFWSSIKNLFEGKLYIWFVIYFLFSLFFDKILFLELYRYWIINPLKIINDLLLVCFLASCAFSYNEFGKKIVRGNDISYGLYIYHMLVVNLLVTYNLKENSLYLIIVLVSTSLLAWLSWKFIEAPLLRFKKKK